MSETVQPAVQEALSEEDRLLSILEGMENPPADSDNGGQEQPDEGAAPAQAAQPEDENEGAEPQETAPIAPPQFWTADAKAHWDTIPAETQAYIAERESQRDAEVRRSQNEAADARRAAEQVAMEIAQERAYLQQQLLPALQAVNQRLQGDFAPETLAELARTNPAEYVAKVAERDRLFAMQQSLQAEELRTRQLAVQGEMQRLIEKVPEWRDQGAARKAMTDMVSLAGEFGYSPQEIGAVSDHRAFLVLKQLHEARAKLAAYEAAKDAPARKAVQQVVARPVNATRPRPAENSGQMSRRQIIEAARGSDRRAQEAAVVQMLGL